MIDRITIQATHHMDRGLAYAEACFETFRIIDGELFAWALHWQRLSQGLQSFGIILAAHWEAEVLQSCLNHAQNTATDSLVRLTISGGQAGWGLNKTAPPIAHIQAIPYIAAQAQVLHSYAVEYPFPIREKIAKFTSDYADTLKAIQIWKDKKDTVQPQQLMICKDGYIISGLTANVVLYQQGQWLTPDGFGVLPGTIRHFLVEKSLIHPQKCPVTLLDSCEAILFINSGQFLQCLKSINGRKLTYPHTAATAITEALSHEQGIILNHV